MKLRTIIMAAAALAGVVNLNAKETKQFKHLGPIQLFSPNGGSNGVFGRPQPGWRKAQSVAAHRETQRRKRRNA